MCAQIAIGDELVVDDGEGVDSCQDEVFGDFVGERFHGDEEDVGIADFLLGLDTPQSDLAIVESDFV